MVQNFTLDELKSFNDDITNLTNLISVNEYVFVARIIKALELSIFEYEKYVKRKCGMNFASRHYLIEHYLRNDCYRVKIKNLKTIKNKFTYIQNNLSKRCCDNTVLDIFDNKNLITCNHLNDFTNDIISICNSISKNDINFINRLKIVINKEIIAIVNESKLDKGLQEKFLDIYYSNNLVKHYCFADIAKTMLNNFKFILSELDNIEFDIRELIDCEEKISNMTF